LIDEPQVAVDYQPAATGPFLWQAFDAARVSADLEAISRAGIRLIRVGLAWDSFMPDARAVDPRRIAELGLLLRAAAERSLRIIPVLFLQAHGDCVLLPRRAVLRDRARPGLRVLSDGLPEPGGPRDPWTDTLMLELADRWARRMAEELAGHPAIAAWDLGDDPASAVRPRRIADLGSWAEIAGAPLRERGDRLVITLGADDLRVPRGVRLSALAPHVDRIDIAVRPERLRDLGLTEASACLLLGELAQRLVGDRTIPVGLAVALPSPREGGTGIDERLAASVADQLLARRSESGLAGLRAAAWTDLVARLGERAPFDRAPWLLRGGLIRAAGEAKPLLSPWSRAARADPHAVSPRPWPPRLDVEDFYAGLPGSLLDLAAAWGREQADHPAILDRGEA
jgi:hypothetical protein